MDDKSTCEYIGRLLQLATPWKVTEISEDLKAEHITIRVEWPAETKAPCPECKRACPVYDHREERSWRHLSIMQYLLELKCSLPRCECPKHGIKTVEVPWAEPRARYTMHFERHAIEIMLACATVKDAVELLRLDWGTVQNIIDRAVERGLVRRSVEKVKSVGLDEKSFLRGQSYVSLMTDMDEHRVLEVVRGRDEASVRKLWQSLPEVQRFKVESAAMDMSQSNINATKAEAPQCTIVHDKFHVSKMLNEAVDGTRREEQRRLLEAGDDTLTNTRWQWLKGSVQEEGKDRKSFAELLEMNLKTAKAWYYKEVFGEFWFQSDEEAGATFFKRWYRSAIHTKLDKVKSVARTLKRHIDNLLTYFQYPITNALTEGFNSRIQTIKANARGFRRFENYRARILFFCGKLEMLPIL